MKIGGSTPNENIPTRPGAKIFSANQEEMHAFDLEKWLSLYTKIADQVAKMHEEGILHFDLKPGNIIYDKNTDEVTIIDFGTALDISNGDQFTNRHHCVGTPVFIAPEMGNLGVPILLSTKQDLYSLGKTFEALFANEISTLCTESLYHNTSIKIGNKTIDNLPTMENFEFADNHTDPKITAMNALLTLIQKTKTAPENRPEAVEIAQQLKDISKNYKNAIDPLAATLEEPINVLPPSLPPQINANDLTDDGFLLNALERECAIQMLSGEQKFFKRDDFYPVQEDHPLYGKQLPYDILKDEDGNVIVLNHNAELGKGAFGAVNIAQAIHSEDISKIQPGQFFALKNQPYDNLNLLEQENAIGRKMGLCLSDTQIHIGNEERYITLMKLIPGKPLDNDDIENYLKKEIDDSFSTTVHKDTDEPDPFSTTVHKDTDEPDPFSTTVHKNTDEPDPFSTTLQKDTDEPDPFSTTIQKEPKDTSPAEKSIQALIDSENLYIQDLSKISSLLQKVTSEAKLTKEYKKILEQTVPVIAEMKNHSEKIKTALENGNIDSAVKEIEIVGDLYEKYAQPYLKSMKLISKYNDYLQLKEKELHSKLTPLEIENLKPNPIDETVKEINTIISKPIQKYALYNVHLSQLAENSDIKPDISGVKENLAKISNVLSGQKKADLKEARSIENRVDLLRKGKADAFAKQPGLKTAAPKQPKIKKQKNKKQKVKKTTLPPKMQASDLKDGFLLSKEERDCVIKMLSGQQKFIYKDDLYDVPKGHPLYGKKSPYDILKDNNGNIIVSNHNAILGKGAYGAVYVAQAIHSEDTSKIQVGQFFAIKSQPLEDDDDDENLKRDIAIGIKQGICVSGTKMNLKAEDEGKEIEVEVFFTLMKLIPGKELAKVIDAYEKDDEEEEEEEEEEISASLASTTIKKDTVSTLASQLNKPDALSTTVHKPDDQNEAFSTTVQKTENQTEAFSTTVQKPENQTEAFNTTIQKPENQTEAFSTTIQKPENQTEAFSTTIQKPENQTEAFSTTIQKPENQTEAFSTTIQKPENQTEAFSTTVQKTDNQDEAFSTTVQKTDNQDEAFSTTVQKPDNQNEAFDTTISKPEDKPDAFATTKQSDVTTVPTSIKKSEVKTEVEKKSTPKTEEKDNKTLNTEVAKPQIFDVNQKEMKDFDVTKWLELYSKIANKVGEMHNNGILHLDLKPENMMYDENSKELTIIDFGTSVDISNGEKFNNLNHMVGSPMFIAPEMGKHNKKTELSTKQDMYSIGKTFELLFQGEVEKLTPKEIYVDDSVQIGMPSRMNPPYSILKMENFQLKNDNNDPKITAMNELLTLIQKLNKPNPQDRPEAAEVESKLNEISQNYKNTLKEARSFENRINLLLSGKIADAFKKQPPFPSVSVPQETPKELAKELPTKSPQEPLAQKSKEEEKEKANVTPDIPNQLQNNLDTLLKIQQPQPQQQESIHIETHTKPIVNGFLNSKNSISTFSAAQQQAHTELFSISQSPTLSDTPFSSLFEVKKTAPQIQNAAVARVAEIVQNENNHVKYNIDPKSVKLPSANDDSLRFSLNDKTNVVIKPSHDGGVKVSAGPTISDDAIVKLCEMAVENAQPGFEFHIPENSPHKEKTEAALKSAIEKATEKGLFTKDTAPTIVKSAGSKAESKDTAESGKHKAKI